MIDLHQCFFIVIEFLKLIISVIPRNLLEHGIVELMMQTSFLVIWIVSRLQIVEQLIHVQDHKQEEDVHCLSMHSLQTSGNLFRFTLESEEV